MTVQLLNQGWSYRPKVSAFAELGGAGGDWEDVTLPHDAQITTARTPDLRNGAAPGYFPGGAWEYRTEVSVPADFGGQLWALEFDGVHRDAMVYVNGALAGQHAFGYSRFVVRIDPWLEAGTTNTIKVDCRTHQDSRWYTGAGIYRDVRLIVKSAARIAVDGVQVTTPDVDVDRAVVEVAAEVENGGTTTRTLRLTTNITQVTQAESSASLVMSSAPVSLLPGERSTVRLRLPVTNPSLWDVDSPTLYGATVVLTDGDDEVDREQVTFGIRTLQLDAVRGLRINGRAVLLRGACIHHDNGPLGAAAIVRAEERRIELLKDAGFNAIRSAHNPMSSALLEACDRLGMLVMDETFDVWTSSKSDFDYASDFTQWWERDVESMVAKDVNHPSVIMYSIGNEIPETGSISGGIWSRRLAEKLRSLDPNRFVTNGINGFVSVLDLVTAGMAQQREALASAEPQAGGVNAMMSQVGDMMNQISASPPVTARTEESFSVLDVAGMNYGDGRYELDHELFPHRVIVGSETFPSHIARNWDLVKRLDHVIGDFTWVGWDYLGEAGLGGVSYHDEAAGPAAAKAWPWLAAASGDLDIIGRRRPVSYYREIVFGLRREPYVAVQRPSRHGQTVLGTPWSWSDSVSSWAWDGYDGLPVTVEVYSDADEVELLLDGDIIGRAAVGAELAFRATIETVWQPGELTAVAYAGGVETGRTSLRSAADETILSVSADRTEITNGTTDLAYIDISLTDTAGVVRPLMDREVTVLVEGAGTLQSFGSGDPAPVSLFAETTRCTFDGTALAIVRPTAAGVITVTVTAPGCASAVVELTVH
ncbi:glycosyl hydrolase family 2 [Curtobacterium sp. PhB130]|uniref:glycoside hydrolase family 2 TIM barrel-domain containing protein n=1 Tax=unclassified Curtobacterium TaxID=257496 RepID=UPI000F4B19AA|nr:MULTISPECIES: glycoside hydrolase family 2 TIM barrel-domain containing protein [unclassified Curtobacterium]ROS76094.1 glycosyl hydrolase family 2 [Curtobacterium sp. PhB130]TCK64209.1 glycosyl hydrolase family 2 [Curtobacterium sp. PhB136]